MGGNKPSLQLFFECISKSNKVSYCIVPSNAFIIYLLKVRPIRYEDFVGILEVVRPIVSFKDLKVYEEWNKLYGCGRQQ